MSMPEAYSRKIQQNLLYTSLRQRRQRQFVSKGKNSLFRLPQSSLRQIGSKAFKMRLKGQDEKDRYFIAGLYPLIVDDAC